MVQIWQVLGDFLFSHCAYNRMNSFNLVIVGRIFHLDNWCFCSTLDNVVSSQTIIHNIVKIELIIIDWPSPFNRCCEKSYIILHFIHLSQNINNKTVNFNTMRLKLDSYTVLHLITYYIEINIWIDFYLSHTWLNNLKYIFYNYYAECSSGCSKVCTPSYRGSACREKCNCTQCLNIYGCNQTLIKEGMTVYI